MITVDPSGCFVSLTGFGSGRVQLCALSHNLLVLQHPKRAADGSLTGDGAESCVAVRLGEPGPGGAFSSPPAAFHPESVVSVGERVWVEVLGSEAGQVYLSRAAVDQRSGVLHPRRPDAPRLNWHGVGPVVRGIVSTVGIGHTDDGSCLVSLPGYRERGGERRVRHGLLTAGQINSRSLLAAGLDTPLQLGDALYVKVLSVEEQPRMVGDSEPDPAGRVELRIKLSTWRVDQSSGVDLAVDPATGVESLRKGDWRCAGCGAAVHKSKKQFCPRCKAARPAGVGQQRRLTKAQKKKKARRQPGTLAAMAAAANGDAAAWAATTQQGAATMHTMYARDWASAPGVGEHPLGAWAQEAEVEGPEDLAGAHGWAWGNRA